MLDRVAAVAGQQGGRDPSGQAIGEVSVDIGLEKSAQMDRQVFTEVGSHDAPPADGLAIVVVVIQVGRAEIMKELVGKDAHQVMLGEHGVVFDGYAIHGLAARDAPSVRPYVIVNPTGARLILPGMDDNHVIHDAIKVRVVGREVEARCVSKLHGFTGQFVDADIAVVVHRAGALSRVTVPPVVHLSLGAHVPLAVRDLPLNVQLRVRDLLDVVPHATGRTPKD